MILALLKLMRLYYALPLAAGLIVIVVYVTAGDNYPFLDKKMVLSFLSLFCIICAGYVLNDICDIETDKINSPCRILAMGKIKVKLAFLWSVMLFVAGLVLGRFCNPAFFLGITIIVCILIFYDIFSKRIGIFKDILVAVLITSLYPLAFTLAKPLQTPRLNVLFIHPFWLFFSCLGYEMLIDLRDIKGDMKVNRKILIHYTKNKWFLITSRIFVVAAALITILPFFFGYCKQIYLLTSITAIILAILSTLYKPTVAIRYIYAEIFILMIGSIVDLLVFGS